MKKRFNIEDGSYGFQDVALIEIMLRQRRQHGLITATANHIPRLSEETQKIVMNELRKQVDFGEVVGIKNIKH